MLAQCGARIDELKRQGYEIVSELREGEQYVRYILKSEPLDLQPIQGTESAYMRRVREEQAQAMPLFGSTPMNPILAIVPQEEVSRPDLAWIKKHVPILGLARALGLRIRRGKAQCWRTENHRHGDSDPSLSFFEKRNRCRCFVCDMKGGHSNVDLVMHILGCELGPAVQWIAERFPVPNVKVGRPVGSHTREVAPYRTGVHGSDWEVIVRSGMWGAITVAERSILVVLDCFKDPETGLTRMSYLAIMRYSGVAKPGNVSSAIKELSRMHALQVVLGSRIGVTRECSTYRVTLSDPKFLELCNAVYASAREEVAQERAYRASQKRDRQKVARKSPAPSLQVVTQNTTAAEEIQNHTCKGLSLSSPGEVHANKPLPAGKREIGFSGQRSIEEQKQILRERDLL